MHAATYMSNKVCMSCERNTHFMIDLILVYWTIHAIPVTAWTADAMLSKFMWLRKRCTQLPHCIDPRTVVDILIPA
jgi:hypothetical protein